MLPVKRADDRVYPRVCGGTVVGAVPAYIVVGLSPRVRGNRTGAIPLRVDRRSIPACAGEPGCCSRSRSKSRVYPRVCGGTSDWP